LLPSPILLFTLPPQQPFLPSPLVLDSQPLLLHGLLRLHLALPPQINSPTKGSTAERWWLAGLRLLLLLLLLLLVMLTILVVLTLLLPLLIFFFVLCLLKKEAILCFPSTVEIRFLHTIEKMTMSFVPTVPVTLELVSLGLLTLCLFMSIKVVATAGNTLMETRERAWCVERAVVRVMCLILCLALRLGERRWLRCIWVRV
jgi:hypothetical protein